jgi:hypothetical protein
MKCLNLWLFVFSKLEQKGYKKLLYKGVCGGVAVHVPLWKSVCIDWYFQQNQCLNIKKKNKLYTTYNRYID